MPFIVIATFRGNTRDTQVYYDRFLSINSFPNSPVDFYLEYNIEWFFGVLSWFINIIGLPSLSIFFLVSFLTFYAIYRTSINLSLKIYEVLPFYLGTFFITQQLMQIRQGMATAIAFWLLSAVIKKRATIWKILTRGGIVSFMHIFSPLIIISGGIVAFLKLNISYIKLFLIIAFSISFTIFISNLILGSSYFYLIPLVDDYSSLEDTSLSRSPFALANIRAIVLLLFFSIASINLKNNKFFRVFLIMYAIHVGIRYGFLDFAIVSGRVSVLLGFAEIFLLPISIKAIFRNKTIMVLLCFIYLVVHAYITLFIVAPFMINDYLTPLIK